MSIEYICIPDPPVSKSDCNEVLNELACVTGYSIIRRGASELGLAPTNDIGSQLEIITISVRCDRIYIAFHAVHGDEQDRVIKAAARYLQKKGYKCDLQED